MKIRCENCGKEFNKPPSHIKRAKHDIDNGETLCLKCHRKTYKESKKYRNININKEKKGWYGVDFDGTLVEYHGWKGIHHIGKPVKPMMNRVKRWLREGKIVKIFTTRAVEGKKQIKILKEWMVDNGLPKLEVTNKKDIYMKVLWDDRCVQVIRNTGIPK